MTRRRDRLRAAGWVQKGYNFWRDPINGKLYETKAAMNIQYSRNRQKNQSVSDRRLLCTLGALMVAYLIGALIVFVTMWPRCGGQAK